MLSCYGRPVRGPLHLLDRNENGLTFALGYALASSRRLVRDLLDLIEVARIRPSETPQLLLQERSAEGITDLEFHAERLHVVLEAKKYGWPGTGQLRRYATKLSRLSGRKVLCPLGAPPVASSPARKWTPSAGIWLKHIRWVDVLSILTRVAKYEENPILNECAELIEEVLAMQAYDREVLVRDVKWGSSSFDLFFRHRLYVCQASEIAEPLFFAPCFSGDALRLQKGIHYFGRVYCRYDFVPGDPRSAREALTKAREVIREKLDSIAGRKTTREQAKYLAGLPDHWMSGLRSACKRIGGKQEHAVFFLGDPIPLPRPVFKKGKMVPRGFSLTLEQLMKGTEAHFNC